MNQQSMITERNRAHMLVEKEQQRLFTVLDALPAFVYLQASDKYHPFCQPFFPGTYWGSQEKPALLRSNVQTPRTVQNMPDFECL